MVVNCFAPTERLLRAPSRKTARQMSSRHCRKPRSWVEIFLAGRYGIASLGNTLRQTLDPLIGNHPAENVAIAADVVALA